MSPNDRNVADIAIELLFSELDRETPPVADPADIVSVPRCLLQTLAHMLIGLRDAEA